MPVNNTSSSNSTQSEPHLTENQVVVPTLQPTILAPLAPSEPLGRRGVRRQGMLFSQDSVDSAAPQQNRVPVSQLRRSPSFGANMPSSREAEAEAEAEEEVPVPPLVRRDAYLRSNSPLRSSEGGAGGGNSESGSTNLRYLPAHPNPTLPVIESRTVQPTFLPKLQPGRKISSPDPSNTNLLEYMQGLPQGSTATGPKPTATSTPTQSRRGVSTRVSNSPSPIAVSAEMEFQQARPAGTPKLQTATASRRNRFSALKATSTCEEVNLSAREPEGTPRPEKCLASIPLLEGKETCSLNTWKQYWVSVANGFIRFTPTEGDMDVHNFGSNSSSHDSSVFSPFASRKGISLPLSGLRCSQVPLDTRTWEVAPAADSTDSAAAAAAANQRSSRLRFHYHHHHPHSSTRAASASEMSEVSSSSSLTLVGGKPSDSCYQFEHSLNGGTRVRVLFSTLSPSSVASTVLALCHASAKENNPPQPLPQSSSSSKMVSAATARRNRKSLPESAFPGKAAATDIGKRVRDKSTDRLLADENQQQEPPKGGFRLFSPGGIGGGGSIRPSIMRSIMGKQSQQQQPVAVVKQDPTSATISAQAPPLILPRTPQELARRVAAIMEPEAPNLQEVNCSGPVFGAPLEHQVPSPDHPGVPLFLQAMVKALETQGLEYEGLYRTPGRQKEINRFICLTNVTNMDLDEMLKLPWHDLKTLCGVIKAFFRRLPVPIFDAASWLPLADTIVDNASDLPADQALAYTLQAISSKLDRLRGFVTHPIGTADAPTAASAESQSWRFPTLEFLFAHLRRVVAKEAVNKVSYQCVAICFGPVIFAGDNAINATKFNKLLEMMIEHWPWLSSDRHPSFADAQAYATRFLAEERRHPTPEAAATEPSAGSVEDSLAEVERVLKDLFRRAGHYRDDDGDADGDTLLVAENGDGLLSDVLGALREREAASDATGSSSSTSSSSSHRTKF